MRWFWLDRFTEFVSGSHATAVKCVSLSEDHLHDHWPYYPLMPNSLVAEGMAQCGGLLVSEVYKFSELVVLAKFAKCEFDGEVRPGDTLRYRTEIVQAKDAGAIGQCDCPCRRPPPCRSRNFFRPPRSRSLRTNQRPPTYSTQPTCCTGCGWWEYSTWASARTAPACDPKTTIFTSITTN